MKLIHPAILAGAALVGLAAFAPSLAGNQLATHHLSIGLPGGGTISYTGNAVPKVSVNPGPFEAAWFAPTVFGFGPSFAALDRLSFDMDRQMDAFVRQAEILERSASSPDLSNAALQTLPAGASYSVMSETVGNGACTRVVQITQRADGEKPEVVSRASGNCDAGTAKALTPGPATAPKAIDEHVTTSTPFATRTTL
jgi:hypothetical protein